MSDDEVLPSRKPLRVPPRTIGIAAAVAAVVIGGAVIAFAGDDGDNTTVGSSTSTTSGLTTSNLDTTASLATTTSSGATTSSQPPSTADTTTASATTNGSGSAPPTSADVDPSGSTTLPPPASTTPPTPSTTGPDTRTPTQAYSQEYEKYCRATFKTSPDGVLYDPDFVTDAYTVDDCLYWLDPEWGEFFDTAAEAAQAGIDDAISTLEDLSPLSSALCWIDAATEQWGGCWYSPNA